MSLSVALAVHNEENNIVRCLKSVYDWADEIVLVDGASTDRTVEMIQEFQQKYTNSTNSNKFQLIHTDNPPMFHINKQKALEKCTGDWILQLDADEEVSPQLRKEISTVISSKARDPLEISRLSAPRNDNFVAYWLPRLNYFLGSPLRKGGQYPDHTIRLYRNGIAHFPCKTVHEQVEIGTQYSAVSTQQNMTENRKLRTENKQIGYLTANLLHFPYPTFSSYLRKWSRYNRLEATELKRKRVSPYSPITFFIYVLLQPSFWFFKTYFRHLGILDGWSGFVFSAFSSLRFPAIYYHLISRN